MKDPSDFLRYRVTGIGYPLRSKNASSNWPQLSTSETIGRTMSGTMSVKNFYYAQN